MFELGTSTRAKALPGCTGINPEPSAAVMIAAAKVFLFVESMVMILELSGARQVTKSVPFNRVETFFPLAKVTVILTEIESPENAKTGVRPPIAIDIGDSAGEPVLHNKSLCPLEVIEVAIDATTGSCALT